MLKTVTTQAARAPLAWKHCYQNIVQLISHVQLCDLIDCSTSVFPVLHCLPELAQIHLTISSSVNSSSSYPQSFPASESFPMSRLFSSGGHSIGVSASASVSVFPMNIQGWFPLRLTGLISLQSKGLSRAFARTAVWKHLFFSAILFEKNQGLLVKCLISELGQEMCMMTLEHDSFQSKLVLCQLELSLSC